MTLIVTLWAVVEKEEVVEVVGRGRVLASSAVSACSADADEMSAGAIVPTLTAGSVPLSHDTSAAAVARDTSAAAVALDTSAATVARDTSAATGLGSSSISMCNAASCCCSALWPVTCDV